MSTVLIVGAGGVGGVVVHKCAQHPEVFSRIHLASRTLARCEQIREQLPSATIETHALDANDAESVAALIRRTKPRIVINVALPYQDLPIMDACLATGTDYLDTANYEPPDEAKFCYKWQWDYHARFKDKGIMALLGCGFDPGVTNVFCAHAMKHHFDEIHKIDILDANAGDHGHPFATNFNPEINIREITQRGKYWDDGEWRETDPLSVHRTFDFPELGPKQIYLLFHEELESLVKHIKGLRRARFWMTFSDQYLRYLRMLEEIGMTSIKPISFEGTPIAPLRFLKAVLPDPASLGASTRGKTCIGCMLCGLKEGHHKRLYIYNICEHETCFKEVGSQAISYTTGVPAMTGAMLMLQDVWRESGVFNMEQLDPDPFMAKLPEHGLPWVEQML